MIWTGFLRWAMWPMGLLLYVHLILPCRRKSPCNVDICMSNNALKNLVVATQNSMYMWTCKHYHTEVSFSDQWSLLTSINLNVYVYCDGGAVGWSFGPTSGWFQTLVVKTGSDSSTANCSEIVVITTGHQRWPL